MKRNFITQIAIVILIFIFIIWVSSMENPFKERDVKEGLYFMYQELKTEFKDLFEKFKEDINKRNIKEEIKKIDIDSEEDSPTTSLDQEEFNRLKNKVLDYAKKE